MVDYDSALPVRTQLVDGDTVDANQDLFLVGGTDGTNYQALSTDASGVLNVNAALVWDDTNKIVITDGTDDLEINADGSINVNSTLQAGTNDIGIVHLTDGTTELDIAVDGSAAKTNGIQILGTDGVNAQILSTDSNGYLNVNTDSPSGANTITYGSVTAVKDTPVTVVSQAGASIATGIQASGSGLMKVEVKYGVTSSETTTIVLYNSTANPNVSYDFPKGFDIASGSTMLISVTNLERRPSTASDFTAHATILREAEIFIIFSKSCGNSQTHIIFMEIGEWDQADYKFKVREYKNKITKQEIMIGRWQLEKDEISLNMANIQLSIDKTMELKKQTKSELTWLENKLEEMNGRH